LTNTCRYGIYVRTKHTKEKNKPGKPELFIVVTHDETHPSPLVAAVKVRERNYTIETKVGDRFYPDGTGKHYVTMSEIQTDGNDKPRLADPNERGIPTLEDEIHVTAPHMSFGTIQTLHIDGDLANATVYDKRPDGAIVFGTKVYVHATADWIEVTIGP